jgi:rRNA-processing protein FCF1
MKCVTEQTRSNSRQSLRNKNPRKKLRVIVDANFLLIPSQFNVDIFEEMARVLNQSFEPVMTLLTYRELQNIAEKSSPKLQRQAVLALKLAAKCRMINVEKTSAESHDNLIVRLAFAMKCCVATNDRELKKKLRKLGLTVIYLRQKSHLAVEGAVQV